MQPAAIGQRRVHNLEVKPVLFRRQKKKKVKLPPGRIKLAERNLTVAIVAISASRRNINESLIKEGRMDQTRT